MNSPFNVQFMAKSPLTVAENEPEKNEKKEKKSVTAHTMSEDTAIKAWSKMSDRERKIITKRFPNFTEPDLGQK
tara:strand:+ start:533 stop:754 length:222 start_codon:yes stop_codon:yes gene_type:complete